MIHELRHVRAFLKVAQTRNITRAAFDLHVSQSALTVQIQQLEESLGVLLFDRNKRGAILTEAGRDVLGPFQRLLDDAEAIVSNAKDLASARMGTVTVAALPTVAAAILPAVLERFGRTHPTVRVVLQDLMAEKVREAVLKRQADIGIATRHGNSDELQAKPLFRDRLVVFAPEGHSLTGTSVVTLREASAYPLILPTNESSVRETVNAIAHRERLVIEPRYETNFMPTALALVRKGLGVTILPESAAGSDAPGFVRVPLGKHVPERSLQLLQRADRTLSPAAQAFVRCLESFLRETVQGGGDAAKTTNKVQRKHRNSR
jgi:LysR family transcriptional regulator, carnitine catabolism transcriptional activator